MYSTRHDKTRKFISSANNKGSQTWLYMIHKECLRSFSTYSTVLQLLGWYLIWNKQYILYRVVENNIFNTGWLTINVLRKSIAALWEYFLWSDQAVKSECKQKVSQYSLDCHPDLLHCGSHLIIFICNISPLQHSLRKLHLSFGCHTACLSGPPGCLKLLISFPLSVVATGHLVASLPGHHENYLIWVGSSLMSPLELRLFHWESFGHCTHSPASLPDHHKNHLIWVDSSLIAPLESPLASAHRSSLPAKLASEPSDLSGRSPCSPPWPSCSWSPWVPPELHL